MEHLSDHSANNDDEYAGTDDDIPPEPQELPTLDIDIATGTQDPTEEGDIGAILDAHAANTGAKQTQVRAKRVVRNPQPKLDPARLSGERGLPTLVRHMEHVKFKGKGYEKDDLNLLMHRMEHWTHRLCPRMTFDEVIARIEKLGSKKPVQVCVKKIRLDIPLLDDDEPVQNMETVEDSNAPSGEKTPEKDEWNFDDLFADKPVAKPISTPVIPAQDEFDELFADSQTSHQPMNIPQTASTPQSTSNALTAEQLKRIEEKRNLAVRRKAARMAQERAEQNQLSQEGKTKDRENGSQKVDEDIIEINEQTQLSQDGKTNKETGSKQLDEDIIEIIDEQNQLSQEAKIKEKENGSQKVDEDIIEINEQTQLSQDGKTNTEKGSKQLDEDIIEIIDEQNQLSQEAKIKEKENGSQKVDEDIIEINEQTQLSQDGKTNKEKGSKQLDEDIIEIIDEQNQLSQEAKIKEMENGSQQINEDIIEIDEQHQLSQEGKTNKEIGSKELDGDIIEIMDESEKQTKFNIADDDNDCIVESDINLKSSCTNEVISID